MIKLRPCLQLTLSCSRTLCHQTSAGASSRQFTAVNDLGNEPRKYKPSEHQLRCKLAAMYRLVDYFGWNFDIYTHLTAKTADGNFLINPFGLLYSEVTASSLVKVDLQGNIVDAGSTPLGYNRTGYVIHSAIHEARPEMECVTHIHETSSVAVSAMSCGLLPVTQEAMILGSVSYHDYEGIAVDEQEKKTLRTDIGPSNRVMILRNHGVMSLGTTVEEAFYFLYYLVRACQVQVQAMSCGLNNLIRPSEAAYEKVEKLILIGGGGVCDTDRWKVGELEYEAWMRLLDNLGHNTGYQYRATLKN